MKDWGSGRHNNRGAAVGSKIPGSSLNNTLGCMAPQWPLQLIACGCGRPPQLIVLRVCDPSVDSMRGAWPLQLIALGVRCPSVDSMRGV